MPLTCSYGDRRPSSMGWVVERPEQLSFREAAAADAAAVAALHADSWRRNYRGAYADEFLDGDVESDRLAVWSARLCAPDPTRYTVVVHDGGALLGFAHLVLDDDARWGSLVDNLHVAHSLKRRGIGTRLIAIVAGAVVARSARSAMYLWVHEQNTAARSFYRARGGVEVERARVAAPGGVPGRLCGSPTKLRVAWADGTSLSC
jgi:ribosomal protein S18 acetylase RimI-like enzyme